MEIWETNANYSDPIFKEKMKLDKDYDFYNGELLIYNANEDSNKKI